MTIWLTALLIICVLNVAVMLVGARRARSRSKRTA
jgi:hypothetical protein